MKKFLALFIFAFALAINVNAQQFKNQSILKGRPTNKKVTFWDVEKAFNEYWKNKKPSEIESENAEEGGWQQFKRWEWFTKQRTFPSGVFQNPDILFNEYQKFKNFSAQKNGSNSTSTANWSFLGPGVVPGASGGAGRINCITFDPGNPQIIWIGTACGGVWKSTDGGVTWSSNTDLLAVLSVSEIVIDPSNTQIMYLATGDKYGIYSGYETWGHYSAGVLKSIDGGVTWNTTGLTYVLSNVTIIERLIQDPASTNTLYAATNVGILKTTNGGTTWNNIKAGSYYDIEMNPANPAILLAGNNTGVIRSVNSGVNWNTIAGVTSTGRTSIAVSAANANTVYAWTEGGNFYYSNNAGVSFVTRTDPKTNCTPYGYYDMVMEVSPINDNIIFTGGLLVALTTDGGLTWAAVSSWNSWPATDYVHADNHALKFANGSSTTIFSCNDGGIFKSSDQGTTWSDLSNGVNIKQYYRLSCSNITSNLIYAGAQDNGTDQVTGINTATRVYGADGEECLIDYTNDNTVFVSTQGGNFNKSIDGGVTFSGVSASGCDWTSPIAMDPTNNNIIYIGGSSISKSIDNGNSWNPMAGAVFDGNCLYSLEICKSQPNTIYAATFGNIYVTMNGGTTWTTITSTLPVGSAAISGIAVSDLNPNAAWVTFSGFSAGNKVFYTNNAGVSWTNVSGTLANIPANCIEYQNGSNDLLYLGTDFGVFYIDASMNNWAPYNTGLPNVIIDELEISYSISKLRAATYGRGLWESNLQSSTLQSLDASTNSLVYPPVTTCDTVIAPIVRIKNSGVSTLTTVNLYYKMDAMATQVYNWVGSLASLATYDITLPTTYTLMPGVHTLKAYTSNPNALTDMNFMNDTINKSFTILSNPAGSLPPITEGFTVTAFPPTNWTLENSSALWVRETTVGGFGTSSECARANIYSISSGIDNIATPYIDFTNLVAPIKLYFDVAYAQYSAMYKDTLIIDLYSDCPGIGERLYAKTGAALATAPPTTTQFTPTPSQWRTDTLHLDSLAGKGSHSIRFLAKTGYGNDLLIDNINLTAANTVGVVKLNKEQYVSVYPNPANNNLTIEIATQVNGKISMSIFDMLGNIVEQREEKSSIGKSKMTIDVSAYGEGIYLIKIQENNTVTTKKITVAR